MAHSCGEKVLELHDSGLRVGDTTDVAAAASGHGALLGRQCLQELHEVGGE